jgi:hypothetical protein
VVSFSQGERSDVDVDVWVRGTTHAATEQIAGVPNDASRWTDEDVRLLLTEMLRAIERQKNPGGSPPAVFLRGFSWIVSPERDGVLVHIEMQMGTASAGPFRIAEPALTDMIRRVLAAPPPSSSVH